MIELRSDNAAGVAPEILAAIEAANVGSALAYGDDDLTAGLHDVVREVFEHPTARVFPVTSGTAANALSLSLAHPAVGRRALSSDGPHHHRRGRLDVTARSGCGDAGRRRRARADRPGPVACAARRDPLGRSAREPAQRAVADGAERRRDALPAGADRRARRDRPGQRPEGPRRRGTARQRRGGPRLLTRRPHLAGRGRRAVPRCHQERRSRGRRDRRLRRRGRRAARVPDQALRPRDQQDAVPVRPAHGVPHRRAVAPPRRRMPTSGWPSWRPS